MEYSDNTILGETNLDRRYIDCRLEITKEWAVQEKHKNKIKN